MSGTSPVDRIRRAFQERAGGAAEQALIAVFVCVLIAGAHVARLGTLLARGAIGGALIAIVIGHVVFRFVRRREARSDRETLRRVLSATDPAIGARALRAFALVERTAVDEHAGSPELASLHFQRVLDRVSTDAVRIAGGKYAGRYRAIAIALISVATLAVFWGPSEVVEGLDVLVARRGLAPLTMGWLGYPRLVAQPPSYTRETERSLVFGTAVALPKGTVLTVRGIALSPDRTLILTDGSREERFTSDGAGGLVARHVVLGDAVLRVAAKFGDVRIEDEDTLEVSVVKDTAPVVEVEGTPRVVKLEDGKPIELRWSARDDYGVREVDLVLRSGPREDRRVLARYDGESRAESGGRILSPHDVFLRRVFLPVAITVEAKDNDPFDGPKWSTSAPVLAIPPEVGAPEAERYRAIVKIRDSLVELLKWSAGAKNDGDRRVEGARLVETLGKDARAALESAYSGASVPSGFRAFVETELDRLSAGRDGPSEKSIEDAVLAVDVASRALGSRDAADVAKKLGDVADDAALSARFARETEHKKDGEARLDQAISVLEKGAGHLVVLSTLGHDLGSVATADLGRIRRAREAEDLTHAELAALHLAGRLHRPSPSFGATTGGSGHGGVESGRGHGKGEGMPSPSSADEEFDKVANEVAELAREHQNALGGVQAALDDANQEPATDADRDEAKKLAGKIRDSAEPLPLPGEEFGTPRAAAALAREHATAAAHALENLSLSEASESAESALGALDQAEKVLDPGDPLRQNFGELRRSIRAARQWAEQKLAERKSAAEARARSSLEQAGDVERELGSQAEKLSQQKPGKEGAALPRELAEGLDRAAGIMREAAGALAAGKGEQGLQLQREAQRLLEQSRTGRSDEPESQNDSANDEKFADKKPAPARGENGGSIALGGDVPGPDDRARAEEFRRRVLEGLGRDASERLSPAVRRYAEGLLR